MGNLADWLDDGAPGGGLREYHHPIAHRLELVDGVTLSPTQLEKRLHRDERSIRNWARASEKALDDMWEAQLGPGSGYLLLLHNPQTGEPVELQGGMRVAILSWPQEQAKRGRPPKGQEWSFALAHPRGKSGGFCIPPWLLPIG